MNKLYDITRKKFKLPTLGFTLVELLAVLVILGLILAIAVPRIVDVIDNTRESAYQINEGMMVSAARNYLVMNDSKNPSKKGTMSIIIIEELQNSELISSINDAQDSNIECDGYVVVKNVDNITFDYMPYLKCENNYQTEGMGNSLSLVQVLVVAGGGGGGRRHGAGGGAGGLIYEPNYNVIPGEETLIIVGSGGIGATTSSTQALSGENSLFGDLVAIGGGAGGQWDNFRQGLSGGSGGGSSTTFIAMGISGQGHNGGSGATSSSPYNWGGGGGAGEPGNNGTSNSHGNGGDGLYFGDVFGEFLGDNGWFAGGGGGGGHNPAAEIRSLGGLGGGGNGGTPNTQQHGEDGMLNTGGGGGGASTISGGNNVGGTGGSGVVIVKYPAPLKAIGGIITTFNGYIIHTFTEVGESMFEVLEF